MATKNKKRSKAAQRNWRKNREKLFPILMWLLVEGDWANDLLSMLIIILGVFMIFVGIFGLRLFSQLGLLGVYVGGIWGALGTILIYIGFLEISKKK